MVLYNHGGMALNAVEQVAAGGSHTLFLMKDGTMMSVGSGAVGQLGHGDNKDLDRPKLIMEPGAQHGFRHVTQVSAGQHHSIALLKNGNVATFGLGVYGQLGVALPHQGFISVPTIVPNVNHISRVEGGSLYTLLYKEASAGQILLSFGVHPNFKVPNNYAQILADTNYSNSMVQESRFWSSPQNEHHGKVTSISNAERPEILSWENERDPSAVVYGGGDSVFSQSELNRDIVGPPNIAKTEIDKDLATRAQVLSQKLEDTTWARADDEPGK